MATDYERLVEQTHKLAESMSKAEKSASGVESIFGKLLLSVSGANILTDAIQKYVRDSRIGLAIQQAFTHENLNKIGLIRREMALTSELHFQERLRSRTYGTTREMASHMVTDLRHQLEILQKQKVVAAEMERLTRLELGYMGLMVTAGTAMWMNARQFNQNLIEANSSWEYRDKLIRQTLVTSAQLGIAFDDVTKAARALVHYGMDTESSFETNLRLVSQMEQGLGVSVDQSARLASIVERQVKSSFEGVSHVIAQIVDDTALAGDEAVRLATAISTALGRLRPGLSAATLPEVVRLVGRYESALKEVGGQSGAFQQLLTSLTSPEGLAGAGALGVSPEFLSTAAGVKNVMERFAQYGQMLVGQSQGWERQMRLQALAQIFNTTADSANQMLMAIERAKNAQMGAITAQERWKEQMNATNSGLIRLGNAISSLLQGAMYPFVFAIGALANKLADAIEWILKSQTLVYTIGIGLGVAVIAATSRIWGLVRSLVALAVSAAGASAATGASGSVSAARIALGISTPMGEFFKGLMGKIPALRVATPLYTAKNAMGIATISDHIKAFFPTFTSIWKTGLASISRFGMLLLRGITALFSPVAILAAGLAWIGYLVARIYRVNQQAYEDNMAAQKIILSKQEAWESQRRARLYTAARYGTSEDVAKVYEGLASAASGMFENVKDVNERRRLQQNWLAEQLASAEMDVAKAVTTKRMFTPLIERTPEQIKADKEMLDVNQRMAAVNQKMLGVVEQRRRDELERRQEEAQERDKLRPWQPSFYWDFYSRLGQKE